LPARVPRLQPSEARRHRGGDPRHPDASPATGPDPRRVRTAPGHRGQDGRPAGAGRDGAAHGVRTRRAATSARRVMSAPGPVFVEAPARLHFGVLDLRGDLGRRFGGVGAAVPSPSLLVEARPAPAPALSAEGPDADRALEFARRFAGYHGLAGAGAGAHLVVHRAIPAHAGLGSGTQLALAVARATAR